MKAMRVIAPGGLDRLVLAEVPEAVEPGAGEVRVRLQAGSLNRHDYAVAVGHIRVADGRIPLSDGAGVVVAAGEGAGFVPGDRVVSCFFPAWADGPPRIGDFSGTPGDGVDGYAREEVTASAHWFTRIPAGYSAMEAATLPTAALTAWRALGDGGLEAGDVVLVLGTGGVSIFALQFAVAAGATVIATSSSDEKLDRLRALGVAHAVKYRSLPDWGRSIFDWTGGRGVDNVIEIG
ncbi:MAG: NAD(P)-dependent alcohol dehydrogenase, partial [Bauldia sp.]